MTCFSITTISACDAPVEGDAPRSCGSTVLLFQERLNKVLNGMRLN
jgi:hypothetical protein